jgi:membrane-associated protease RseP (regulator of RpoE activity)
MFRFPDPKTMRYTMRSFSRSTARTALFLALCASCASAQDPSVDPRNGRGSVVEGQRALDDARRPVDPKFRPGWERFCAEDADRGGCEVIMQRIGRKPVIGVVLAPDPQGGVRIAGVTPDGAAAGAGIKTGDRLVRIGGKAIAGATPEARVDAARALLQAGDDKTPVTLAYARDGRESEVSLTPKLDSRIMVFAGDGQMMRPGGNVVVRRIGDRTEVAADSMDVGNLAPGAWHGADGDVHVFAFEGDAPGAHRSTERRVVRIECKKGDEACLKRADARAPFAIGDGPRVQMFRFDCKPGESCAGQHRLAEAFRWNGLNLASVDAQLGRYFGTDKGVLVLSAGPALGTLQPGDVIQRVDGKAVDTPRAVMDALRDKPADSAIAVDYLRDRKSGTTQVKVPKAMPFPLAPPMPPIPPAAPGAPKAGADAHAPAAAIVTRRSVVMVDKDGQVSRWEDDGDGPAMLPPAPPMPPAAPLPPPPPPRVD